MSLNSIEYITKNEYIKDKYSDSPKATEDKDLDNFFRIKINYFEELSKFAQEKVKKITTIIHNDGEQNESVTTNYPIKFSEEDGKYIITVINDEKPNNILYTKSISINKRINIVDRLSEIEQSIKNNNFIIKKFSLFSKIESLRRNKLETDVLNSEKMISDDEKEKRDEIREVETNNLRKEYTELKIKNSSLNIESKILSDILAKFIETKIQKYSTYSIDMNCEQNKSNKMFKQLINLVGADNDQGEIIRYMLEYVKLQQIINQTGDNLPGDIVFYNEEGVKSMGFIRSDVTSGATEKVMIETSDRDIIEVSYNEVIAIQGLRNLFSNVSMNINNFSITYEEYRQYIAKVYPEQNNLLPEYQRQINIIDDSEGNLIKSGKVNYTYNYKGTQKTKVDNILRVKSIKKKQLDLKTLKSSINIIDEDKLYSNNDIFMFYSDSANSKPGRGTKEEINSESQYSDLKIVEDWRKKLSNFHIRQDKKGNITPIIIDGIPFASVEHYFHFSKFWNVASYGSDKKDQYNNYALKFTFNYKGDDGWGKLDGSKAKLMGGKNQGFPHRPDWFKPVKGINKESIDKSQQGGGNFITLRDYTLLKGIFAKFSQFDDLKNMLVGTGNAKLIHPIGGSPRKNEYEVAFQLVYTRHLINNSHKLVNYDNFDNDVNKIDNAIYFLMAKSIKEKRLDLNKHVMSDVIGMISKSLRYSIYWKKNVIKSFTQGYINDELNIDEILKRKGDLTPSPQVGSIKPISVSEDQDESKSSYSDDTGVKTTLLTDSESQGKKSTSDSQSETVESESKKVVNIKLSDTPVHDTRDLDSEASSESMEEGKDIQTPVFPSGETDVKVINLGKSDKKHSDSKEQFTMTPESIDEDESSGEEGKISSQKLQGSELKAESKSPRDDLRKSDTKVIKLKDIKSKDLGSDLLSDHKASSGSDQEEGSDHKSPSGSDQEEGSDHKASSGSDQEEGIDHKASSESDQEEGSDHKAVSGTDQEESSGHKSSSGSDQEEKGKPAILRTESEQMKEAISKSILTNQELLQKVEDLNIFIDEQGKTIYPVPPDGNCGYYSIVETMAIADIYPLNFSEEGESMQYSRERKTLKVSFAEEEKHSEILYNAMLELRRDTAMKFSQNFLVGEKQEDSIEAIKVSISNTLKSDTFTQEVVDKYVESIRERAESEQQLGSWITDIELGLISAMFNININVYNSNKTITNYEATKYKNLYPAQPNRNMGAAPKTIQLGYISNYHYVGVVSKGVEQISLENIQYYTISLEAEEQPYEIAIDLNKIGDNEYQVIPLGLYNPDTHKIKSLKPKKKPLHASLYEEFTKFIERHNPNGETITNEALYTRIDYYKDISSGKIYRASSIESEELGKIKVRNLKQGKTYSQIVFN